MSFKDLSIEEYNRILGEKKSTPGGGSALAITLSLACSLCLMVINFTIDKKGYEDHKERLLILKEKMEQIEEKAFSLADEDSLTFKALMASYKYQDSDLISQRAKECCLVSYNLYLYTEQVEAIARELILKGNKNLISDAKIAASLCISIYPGCKMNIEANMSSIKDSSFIEQMKSIF
ncbi:MAG: cyclodeaminase/cyclohydrolase family protein [Bacilli bacterium]